MYRKTCFQIPSERRTFIRLLAAVAGSVIPHISCAQPKDLQPAPTETAPIADCLADLTQGGVTLQSPNPSHNIELPVQIDRKLGALTLVPRGPYPALMDCSLALALQKAAPVFLALGLNELHFSAAYDHRTRRGSTQLSSHSFGRAIDVHMISGPAGPHDIISDFERGVGTWLGISPRAGALEECIGSPATDRGRTLRTLVCRLKLETELRIIVTPDDNDDHRDHIHLEYALPYRQRSRPIAAEAVVPRPVKTVAPSAPAVKATRGLIKKKRNSSAKATTASRKKVRKKSVRNKTAAKKTATKKTVAKKPVAKPVRAPSKVAGVRRKGPLTDADVNRERRLRHP